jgi:hypothetical protein
MRLKVKEDSMLIIPETPQDEAFLKYHFKLSALHGSIVGKYVLDIPEQHYSHVIKFESMMKEEK